jgi:hypothetical protein
MQRFFGEAKKNPPIQLAQDRRAIQNRAAAELSRGRRLDGC